MRKVYSTKRKPYEPKPYVPKHPYGTKRIKRGFLFFKKEVRDYDNETCDARRFEFAEWEEKFVRGRIHDFWKPIRWIDS